MLLTWSPRSPAALAGHRKVKGIAHDALASLVNTDCWTNIPNPCLVDAPSDGGASPRCLADDVIIDVARLAVCERRLELEHALAAG